MAAKRVEKMANFLPKRLPNENDMNVLLADAYSVFTQDFVTNHPYYLSKRIDFDRRVINDGKEEGFWHLVTREKSGVTNRLPEKDRARCIPWIRPIIENSHYNCVTSFRYLEGSGKERTYLWVEDEDYVVILEERRTAFTLVTSFNVDQPWKRKSLRKKVSKKLN